MIATCVKRARIDGVVFEPDTEYNFEEQAFTEEYNPAMHPRPARGPHIRYLRYKATMPMPFGSEAFKPGGTVEMRTVYFYDLVYCQHHNWRDEQGNPIECFDHHFALSMPKCENFIRLAQKKQLYTRLPQIHERKLNARGEIEMPADLVEYMKQHMKEQMYKMFGGLSPDDWDYDRCMELIRKKKENKEQN
jgi:hypothetical protein